MTKSHESSGPPGWLALLLASACGLIVANLYYAQPLIGLISASLGLEPGAAGLIVTLAQVGYGLGLLFIVPLGDLVENRLLVLILVGLCTLALAGAGFAPSAAAFLAATALPPLDLAPALFRAPAPPLQPIPGGGQPEPRLSRRLRRRGRTPRPLSLRGGRRAFPGGCAHDGG